MLVIVTDVFSTPNGSKSSAMSKLIKDDFPALVSPENTKSIYSENYVNDKLEDMKETH